MVNGASMLDNVVVPPNESADELVGLLGLAASQIEIALREAEAPIAQLASFIESAGITNGSSGAAVALQFHDRLTQRLTHVRDTLAYLAKFVGNQTGNRSQTNWQQLRQDIRGQYSMEQERVIFDLLVGGATPDQVLSTLTDMSTTGASSHVDLF